MHCVLSHYCKVLVIIPPAATLLLHTNKPFKTVNKLVDNVWLLSIPILSQCLGIYGSKMWNVSTGADIMLQICLITRDRFKSLDFSPFAYVLPAYLLVIFPLQQLYFFGIPQEEWSDKLISNEKILKCLAVFLLVELNSIVLLSKHYSARYVKQCEWAKWICNKWFILMFTSICIINSLLLTLVIWGIVDDSVQQLFNNSELIGNTSVLIKSLLTFAFLTRLLRQLMEGVLFLVDSAGEKSRWYNSKRMCHGLFPSVTFLIQTFLVTFIYIHQHRFVVSCALVVDICFRITLSPWIFRNSYSSTTAKMYIRQYLMWYHSALWQIRSLLKVYIVGIINAFWGVLFLLFHCISVLFLVLMERQAVEPFQHAPLQGDQEVQAEQLTGSTVNPENVPHERFEIVSGVYHGHLLQTLQSTYLCEGSLTMSLPTSNLPLQTLHSGCFEEPDGGFLDHLSQKSDCGVPYEDIHMPQITFSREPLQESVQVHQSPVVFEQQTCEDSTLQRVSEIRALSEDVEQLKEHHEEDTESSETKTSDHGPIQPVPHENLHYHVPPWQALHGSSFELQGGLENNMYLILFPTIDQWSPEPDISSGVPHPEPFQETTHVYQQCLVPGILLENKSTIATCSMYVSGVVL